MITKRYNIISLIVFATIIIANIFFPGKILALNLDTYSSESVLKDGHWVKISVTETGMHLIPASDLKAWGFSDPSKVHVYGYGGERLPDVLNSSYIDDLPIVSSVNNSQGIYFYAKGPVTWNRNTTPHSHSLNPYSTAGYYFLCDKAVDTKEIPSYGTASADDDCATSFYDAVYYEKDQYSPGATGHLLLGEDFKYTSSQNFNFTLTDKVDLDIFIKYSFSS